MSGKYIRLEQYLRDLPVSQQEVSLTFKQIERILNDHLPDSAYESELWWTKAKEANHVTLRAWAKAGWKVRAVSMDRKQVDLIRVK